MVEKLFTGCDVYYSGSIRGVPEPDPEFPWRLVQFMLENGADVLSEHVAARTPEEMIEIRARRMGTTVAKLNQDPVPWITVRDQDMAWVDQATHVVALVNGPSHGVGMEIEHALLKPMLGENVTPILALVREDLAPKVTFMIRGITDPNFELQEYSDLASATAIITQFLLRSPQE
jgi:hypothetical protein